MKEWSLRFGADAELPIRGDPRLKASPGFELAIEHHFLRLRHDTSFASSDRFGCRTKLARIHRRSVRRLTYPRSAPCDSTRQRLAQRARYVARADKQHGSRLRAATSA